ncbi:phospholipase C, phosphocholine-specific [Acidobacteria bacterium AB60]|nr:phospholipase C, phosphocholine-specific [Acidobacteria bacterium AB60]
MSLVTTNRRTFLQMLSAGAVTASFPASIARALEIEANDRTRSIEDVEHIVILMQENRSFDHYFGSLRGVRGFGDPRVAKLPNGDPVWYQPDGKGRYVLPFRPDVANLGLAFIEDTDHGWNKTHVAWNNGVYDGWVEQKSSISMTHLTRQDIPFHYALADAFTVCDDYHCSLLGPTDPNRYHMWTGWVGNDGSGGGPVLDNAEAGYGWSTYPERLVKAGISWKIYQDQGLGLNAAQYWGWGPPYIGNYGDNSLLYFHQYQNATPGTPLFEGALTGTDINALTGTNPQVAAHLVDQFRADVLANKLPQVSWIVAPEVYCEHPNWPANYGAWYIAQFLDALTANPKVWAKTAFFLTYDENDGLFDHKVPPTPPANRAQGISTVPTTNELMAGLSSFMDGPIGLGVRVPMVVISPWSKGGYVSSEVFDHTSLIRFIEARYAGSNPGLVESNITPWRRAVAGDLTSAFNFRNPNAKVVALPSTAAYVPPDQSPAGTYVLAPPANQALPAQETGVRPARPVPYRLSAHGTANFHDGTFALHFGNEGKTAVYQVRSGNSSQGPWTYTVGSGAEVADTYAITANNLSGYDLSVYGPNGFFRGFKGSVGKGSANLDVRVTENAEENSITLAGTNRSAGPVTIQLKNGYTGEVLSSAVGAGASGAHTFSLNGTHGWYDFTIEVAEDAGLRYQVAGHVETGEESFTDPAIAV